MVNLHTERDYDEYSHYALRYSMISTGTAELGLALPKRPKKKDLQFFNLMRNGALERFATLMNRARGMSDVEYSNSLEFFQKTCRMFDERNSQVIFVKASQV